MPTQANMFGTMPIAKASNPLMRDLLATLSGSITGATTVAAAATETSAETGTYDCSASGATTLIIYYSEDLGVTYRPITVTLSGIDDSALTEAEVVAAINADVMASRVMVAADATGVVLSAKIASPNVQFYVGGGANTLLGFTAISDATAKVGTGTVASMSFVISDRNGNPVKYANIVATLYAGSTGATKDTTAEFGRCTAGHIVSGVGSNTETFQADKGGRISFEVADTGASAQTAFIEFSDAETGVVCDLPATRTEITTGT